MLESLLIVQVLQAMQQVIDNLSHVHRQIEDACAKVQRNSKEITLLCVSKTKPVEMIKAAYATGERHFGESYTQEAVIKIPQLKEQGYNDIIWHFIGPIQSNKTRHIAAHFDVVESVDRIKILDRLNEQRPDNLPVLQVLLQVNISHEEQKQGCDIEELDALLEHAEHLPKLEVIGLMGVARDKAPEAEIAQSFELLKTLLERFKPKYSKLRVLSMGMTHDMELALQHGSTELRIGSAIFGERDYSKKQS